MPSCPMPSRSSRRNCAPATLWSWITCQPTGLAVCARRSRTRERGLLFLPPYSPDFNPIEMAFSKLKALLRKVAARAIDELWSVIADCLRAFKPNEFRNYFEAAGYDPE